MSDSPDWLRSFQPPTRSITTVSSDSGTSADKIPDIDYCSQQDDKPSVINTTATKRPNVAHDIPAKRRKTLKHNQLGTQDDVKLEGSLDKPITTSELNHSVWALSSDSESDANDAVAEETNKDSPLPEFSVSLRNQDMHNEEDAASKMAKKGKSPKKQLKLEQVKAKEKKKTNSQFKMEGKALTENEANDISPAHKLSESLKKDGKGKLNGDSTPKVVRKTKSPRKKQEVGDVESTEEIHAEEPLKIEGEMGDAVDERLPEKHNESRVSSSTLSLILPEKVSRSKALVECEGESIDLSGDMGAVGRVIIPENPSGEPELFLDLKGTIYKTAIVPSRTFCVVSIGPSEAKIEAIMNDFIQLKAQSNVYDAETMVEGTLEGFSFDSEDEADKTAKDVKPDQNEDAEEQAGKKPGGKVEKKLGATQKKGKATGGKQPKKRKPQATKKSKGKK